MKQILLNLFKVLSNNTGEDIFEYGWGDFEEKNYLNYLYQRNIISKELWTELFDDGAELFQIIQAVDEDDYDKCLEEFVNFLCSHSNEDELAELMWNFEN